MAGKVGPALEARTPRTITDPGRLARDLAEVRGRGYAADWQELEVHLCCVAAPVFARSGRVVASISDPGNDDEFSDEREAR